MQDSNIIKAAKECVEKLLETDPLLAFQEHQGMKSYYVRQYKGKINGLRLADEILIYFTFCKLCPN